MIIGWGVSAFIRHHLFCPPLVSIAFPEWLSCRQLCTRQMLCGYEGATLFKELLFSHGNILPGNKCTQKYILDFVAQFVAWKYFFFLLSHLKTKWITQTHTCTKTDFSFSVRLQVAVFRNIMPSLEIKKKEAWLILLINLKPSWIILAFKPSDLWIF